DPIRQRLALVHARDLGNQVIEALEMLDVDCRPDADTGLEELLYVLPALRVTQSRSAAREIGMRELIDKQDLGMTLECSIEVEFLSCQRSVAHGERRQPLQPFEEPLGFHATVRLDVSDHYVLAGRAGTARSFEHRVGLADTCRCAEENAQPPPLRTCFLRLHVRQKLIRVRSYLGH